MEQFLSSFRELNLGSMMLRILLAMMVGGVIGFEGQVMTVIPHKTACLRCIFEAPPTGCETCESHGIIGAAAGMIGCIQALEAIKFITSRERLLTDKMFIFDMLTMKTRTAKFGGISSRCSICQNNQ